MCRSIKTLRDGADLMAPGEVEAAALQFVRKVSGFRTPTGANRIIFEAAVTEIAAATDRLLTGLTIAGRPTSRAATE